MGPYHPIIEEIIKSGENTAVLVFFLLTIPIIFSIQNIFRYIIGIKNLNTYSTLALTFLVYNLTMTSTYTTKNHVISALIYSFIIIVAVTIGLSLCYQMLSKTKLHYYTKTSLILMSTTIVLFIILFIAQKINENVIIQMNPINIILIHILAEQILGIHTKSSIKGTIKYMFEGLLIAGTCVLFLSNLNAQTFILKNPWIVLFAIPINVIIGKYTGLRLREYFRFSTILNTSSKNNENTGDSEE
jgi:hypothetical protein